MNRKLKMGMVGGGRDAFIGAVHRMAANLDGEIELVCGAFSSSPEKSRETGKALYLDENRVYGDFEEMITREAGLPDDIRMDFVSIVTPNHVHYGPASFALKHGFHVMIDKPLAFSLKEANDLEELVNKSGLLFGVTHTYTGYPMVKQARHMVASGQLGKVRKVYVEYPQGWLTFPVEETGHKQAAWRTDPARSGKAGCMGDIGTHAENMVEFVTGLQIKRLCAQLNIVVPGRPIDDDGAVLLEFDNGATGVLTASQIAAGEENDLKIRVYGEKGGVEWSHADPNTLLLKWQGRPTEILRTGADRDLCQAAMKNLRLPAGHPEGYLEAFANLYKNFAHQIKARLSDTAPDPDLLDVPGVADGVRGMLFIDKVVESSENGAEWVNFEM
jgi:predicted dehydrogenase